MRKMKTGSLALLMLAALGSALDAAAQTYPTRTIHILTTGAGGGGDLAARLITPELGASLGQSVVVENRPNTATLAPAVAKSPADGYTLLVWGGALWLQPLMDEQPYDAFKDFTPITTLTRSPALMVVHASVPARSVAELIKLIKSRPGQFNYSAGPTGSSSQLAGDVLKSMAGLDYVMIYYKGGSQITPDLLSGNVQFTIGQAAAMVPEVKSGKLRALASAGSKRSALFPDLPTVAETLPGFVSESLFGMWAPAGTPAAIVKRLNQETVRALDKPDVKDKLLKSGAETVGGAPEDLTEAMRSEVARVSKALKDLKKS